jgi:hypothetical protein
MTLDDVYVLNRGKKTGTNGRPKDNKAKDQLNCRLPATLLDSLMKGDEQMIRQLKGE